MADRTLGQIIDDLDVEVTLEDGELVEAAIVILKMVGLDGSVWLKIRWHDGVDVFTRIGMLRSAVIDAESDFESGADDE